ncbi:hypothetical protein FI667_g9987, partial [Globisporangium splendens]
MNKPTKKAAANYGKVPFALDASDLELAKDFGLLQDQTPVNCSDSTKDDYGVAYNRQQNIGVESFSSQKAIQARCKEFAVKGGFQLFVKFNSTKAGNFGNAKCACKKLNGQQYFAAAWNLRFCSALSSSTFLVVRGAERLLQQTFATTTSSTSDSQSDRVQKDS